jgi:hypothetical protein
MIWLYVAFRSIPFRDGDRGVFASMGERIAAGDILYVDVWDNKEPLFFLTIGAGRLLSPTMDVILELAWIFMASLAIYQIMRKLQGSRLMAVLAGFGGTPLIVTGGTYAAGFSHLPATTIFLGIIALAVHRKWVAVGALIVVLAGFKLIVVPVAILGLIPLLAGSHWRNSFLRVASGVAATGVALTLLLTWRGEFIGFINLIRSNIGYSQSSIADAYDVPILKHIEPVFSQSTVITVCAALIIVTLVYIVNPHVNRAFRATVGLSLLGAFIVTAITGLWEHHGQLFYGPAALALALLFGSIASLSIPRMANVLLVMLVSFVLAAMPSLRAVMDTVLSGPTRFHDLSRVAQPTQDLLDIAQSGTYQRLGMNTDDSHAYGLQNFDLNCYQFVQYTYDLQETLNYIPACLPTTGYVLVDRGFTMRDGSPTWNEFVRKSEMVLSTDFNCIERDWGRLCTNTKVSE